jgi:hypothetical protein
VPPTGLSSKVESVLAGTNSSLQLYIINNDRKRFYDTSLLVCARLLIEALNLVQPTRLLALRG